MKPTQVYLIDDDAALRGSLAASLESEGVLVKAFAGVPAFIEWIDYDAMPEGACILSAMQLPEMNGLDLLNVLAADEISLPTVLMMAEVDLRLAVESMRYGASYVIQKPVSRQLLLDTLELVMADGSAQHKPLENGALQESLHDIEQRVASLSPRQREILAYVFDGKLNKVIADKLGISIKTVELHRARMMEKMRAESVIELIKMTAQCSGML
ncbi:MAG: response regulator transcription factor, partial [Pseudomonadales bacterium]